MVDLLPTDIGLPSKFTTFRPSQWDAIEFALYSTKRFTTMNLPTGSGKSLIARAISLLTRQRSVIVTSTKGLADQYQLDFGPARTARVGRRIGVPVPYGDVLYDVRGKENYRCVDTPSVSCADGPKLGCGKCPAISCNFHSALSDARSELAVSTNYAFWMNINRAGRKGAGGGLTNIIGRKKPIEVLILDEAHTAPEELVRFLQVRVGEKEVRAVLGTDTPECEDIDEWVEWARPWGKWCEDEVRDRTAQLIRGAQGVTLDDIRRLEGMGQRLKDIAAIGGKGTGGWVCEGKAHYRTGVRTWEFEPIWPGQYAESALFHGIAKVILVSATVKRKTMGILGVKGHEMDYREWPRVFPKHRSPVYHFPTVRMNYHTTPGDLRKWVEGIDMIIGSRGPNRKGLIHTVSYDRQQFLMDHSRYRKWFIGNKTDPTSETAAEVVKRFKAAKAPCVLVSPSFGTGWDFPGEECEWIIVGKVPWPVTKSKVMKARMKRDKQYASAVAMQDLVQMAGRGMRFDMDRCEVFICDDTVGYFMVQNKQYAPDHFEIRRLVRAEMGDDKGKGKGLGVLPKLPPKLPL